MTTDNTETKDREAQLVRQLLDSYFRYRRSLQAEDCILECKTTEQIRDELLPMYDVSMGEIARYLIDHGYVTITEPDGTLAWAIWRNIQIFGNKE